MNFGGKRFIMRSESIHVCVHGNTRYCHSILVCFTELKDPQVKAVKAQVMEEKGCCTALTLHTSARMSHQNFWKHTGILSVQTKYVR